jgi:hypothetical protein
MAGQDSGTVKEEIASRRSLYVTIMAAISIVGMVGIGASLRFRSGASLPPEIPTISENAPAEPQLEKTNRSDVPPPDASTLGVAPQPTPVAAVNNVAPPVDPQPQEAPSAAETAAPPEQIETQVEPSRQRAPFEPEKMNTASVERHDAAKIVPLPVPRPSSPCVSSQRWPGTSCSGRLNIATADDFVLARPSLRTLVKGDVVTPRRTTLELAGTPDPLIWILDHLLPLRDPAGRARHREKHGEHGRRKAHRFQGDA